MKYIILLTVISIALNIFFALKLRQKAEKTPICDSGQWLTNSAQPHAKKTDNLPIDPDAGYAKPGCEELKAESHNDNIAIGTKHLDDSWKNNGTVGFKLPREDGKDIPCETHIEVNYNDTMKKYNRIASSTAIGGAETDSNFTGHIYKNTMYGYDSRMSEVTSQYDVAPHNQELKNGPGGWSLGPHDGRYKNVAMKTDLTRDIPPSGHHNIIVGLGAGKQLTTESYCVIFGEDSTAVNIQGSDYLWYVDYESPYLKARPELTGYLKSVEQFGLQENHESRMKIYEDIVKYLRP